MDTFVLNVPCRTVRTAGGPVVKDLIAVGSFADYRRNITDTLVQISEPECLRINYVNPGVLVVQKAAEIVRKELCGVLAAVFHKEYSQKFRQEHKRINLGCGPDPVVHTFIKTDESAENSSVENGTVKHGLDSLCFQVLSDFTWWRSPASICVTPWKPRILCAPIKW